MSSSTTVANVGSHRDWTLMVKTLTFALLAAPLAWLAYAIVVDLDAPGTMLGADPQEYLLLFIGEWALRWLLLGLALSPIQRRLGLPALRQRRMVGLFAFAYVSLHLAIYLWLFAGFDLRAISEDLVERTYITAGFLAWLILIPLAATSTNAIRRWMGRRWRTLHKAVYAAVGLGLLHLFWLTKAGYGEPLLYAAIFTALVGERWLHARGH